MPWELFVSSPTYNKGHQPINKNPKGTHMNTKDFLAQFTQETLTFIVEAWNQTEVKIRKLTIKEQAHVNSILYGELTLEDAQQGSMNIDLLAVQEAQIQTVAYALIEPKLAVEDINKMPTEFLEGVTEIADKLTEDSQPKK